MQGSPRHSAGRCRPGLGVRGLPAARLCCACRPGVVASASGFRGVLDLRGSRARCLPPAGGSGARQVERPSELGGAGVLPDSRPSSGRCRLEERGGCANGSRRIGPGVSPLASAGYRPATALRRRSVVRRGIAPVASPAAPWPPLRPCGRPVERARSGRGALLPGGRRSGASARLRTSGR